MQPSEWWFIWKLTALLLIGGANGIYDPRAHSGPNANMMPQVHGDYSKVHTHNARSYDLNYYPSYHYYQAPLMPYPTPMPTPTTARPVPTTKPSINAQYQQLPAQKLKQPNYGYGVENAILDASNPKLRNAYKPTEEDVNLNGLQCPPLQTGHFIYKPDCRQFLNCWKGRGYVQTCAPGTLFNPDTLKCDHEWKVQCMKSSLKGGSSAGKPLSNPKTAPYRDGIMQIQCPSGVIGLLEHPTDCTKFIDCNDGAIAVKQCGPGTAFNPRISVCDHIINVDCNRYENLIEEDSPKEVHPDVEIIDAEEPVYDIDRRFNVNVDNDRSKTTTASSVPLHIPKPKNQQPVASEIRPVYVPVPTTATTSTTRKPNQPQARNYPTYSHPNTKPSKPLDTQTDTSDQQMAEALKLLLRPYLSSKNVDLNMTKMNSMMGQTTTAKPHELAVIGLNHDPKTDQPQLPKIPSAAEINAQLSNQQVPNSPGPLVRPPASYGFRPYNPNYTRQHASAPVNANENQQPLGAQIQQAAQPVTPNRMEQPQRLYPVYQPEGKLPSQVQSRIDTGPNQWRPFVAATTRRTTTTTTTTPKPTTTTEDPCFNKFQCGNANCIDHSLVCDGKDDCGNRKDEQNCEQVGYEIRLSDKHQGKIEVKVFDKWGYVCDDEFTLDAAHVVCRELGFAAGAVEMKSSSLDGDVLFVMDEVKCTGNESSLRECAFSGWGVHDCSAEEVMGVVCKKQTMTCPDNYWLCETSAECVQVNFLCDNVLDCADGSDEDKQICNAPLEMRLVDGPSHTEGRVEVKYRGMWGTICDENFGKREARVVCRQMGLNGTVEVHKNKYKAGTGQIWLGQVVCNGDEESIDDCMHWDWGEHSCSHNKDIGVRCGAPPKPTPARLMLGSKSLNHEFIEKSSKIHPDTCGKLMVDPTSMKPTYGSRVIHGSETVYGHHPWQAALRVKKSGMSVHWCGAVIISRYHILTAAHCLSGYAKGTLGLIRLGDYDFRHMDEAEIDIFIEDYYVHENFRVGHEKNNDIALVLLRTPIRFNQYVQPICLPSKNEPYREGMKCKISGWGSMQSGSSVHSLELRAAEVPILSDTVCKQPEVYGNNLTEGMFCAGALEGGVDACEGDSGGPLVCTNERGHTLYGIISWGFHCGYVNKPGVYVKVAHYVDWIEEKLRHSLHMYGV